MSSSTIDLLFGVTGQSLYFDAPEGRPSSVTSSDVFENTTGDDGTEEAATSGSAAVETNPNTTFDAASGAGQADARVCNLAATTGVKIGQQYRATNAAGEVDIVEVAAIVAAATVTARQPLVNAYTTGDTFESTRVTHAIDATWVADKNNLSGGFDPNPKYRWRLVYVVGGVTYAHDLYFDLLRYAGRHDVSPIDVDRRARGWMERVSVEDREDQGRSVIDEAYQVVKFDLYNLTVPDQSIRNREVVNELVKLKAIELVDGEAGAAEYSRRFAQLMEFGKTSTSKTASAAASPGEIISKWSK